MDKSISSDHALDIIADMFKLSEDWCDIYLARIEEIINLTGRSTEPYLICQECSECFEQEENSDQQNSNYICKQCIKIKENNNE